MVLYEVTLLMLVIITGTSKGIGFELMKQFAQTDVLVLAVSRNIKSIEAYIKKNDLTNVLPLSLDIATKSGIDRVSKVCKSLNKPVSILINNAGSLIKKPFKKISEKEITEVYKQMYSHLFYSLKPYCLIWEKRKAHTL